MDETAPALPRSFERAQLYEAFKKLDVFKQNCLTRESLQAVLKSSDAGSASTAAEIEKVFAEVDFNRDGHRRSACVLRSDQLHCATIEMDACARR